MELGNHRPVVGSRPVHVPAARQVTRAHADDLVEVTVVLPPATRSAEDPLSRKARWAHEGKLATRDYLSLDDLGELKAPAPDDVTVVEEFAKAHGLTPIEYSSARHDIVLEGSVSAVESAFKLVMQMYEVGETQYRAHDSEIHLPVALQSLVTAILGVDEIPRRSRPHLGGGGGVSSPMTLPEITRHYSFPAVPAGEWPHIALMEFGGGYYPTDMEAYFSGLGLPVPRVTEIAVRDRMRVTPENSPLDQEKLRAILSAWKRSQSFPELICEFGLDMMGTFMSTVEVTMDLQILGGVANSSPIDLYFASPTVVGWRRAMYAALGAPYPGTILPEEHEVPAVMSMSWGASEAEIGPMQLGAVQDALEAATLLGVTLCCSSGDWGSRNSPVPTKEANVNFPASSPFALACGGTGIRTKKGGSRDIAWNQELKGSHMASGGGMSGFFPAPSYQKDLPKADAEGTWTASSDKTFQGRRVPDVAANADFASGFQLIVGGEPFIGGGTSAAAPLWAALMARISTRLGRPLGFFNPFVYRSGAHFDDVIDGDNDVSEGAIRYYEAKEGWDPCTGWGVPRGEELLESVLRDR